MRAVRIVMWGIIGCLSACAGPVSRPPSGQEEEPTVSDGVVKTLRATTLRERPAPGAYTLTTIPAGTSLRWVEGQSELNFYRVVGKDKGPLGWVRAADVEIVQKSVAAGFHAMAACADALAECPLRGCAAPDSPDAAMNEMKHNIPSDEIKATLTFDDFASLQEQADDLVGSGGDITEDQRKALSNLNVATGTVAEGDHVRLLAFLPSDSTGPHPNSSGESVNCRLTGSASNDFHIPVTEDPSAAEFDAVVVEMIPQQRPTAWTTSKLKKVQQSGLQVWIEGSLFYDNAHVVNNDPGHPIGGQPKRFSLWEVHPVTKFLVCRQAQCDPDDESVWTAL